MLFDEAVSQEEINNGYEVAVHTNILNELFSAIAKDCPTIMLTKNDGGQVPVTELVNPDAPFVVDYWIELASENGMTTPPVENEDIVERIANSPVLGQIHAEANRAVSQIRQMRYIGGKRNDGKYDQAVKGMEDAVEPYLKALEIANSFAEGFKSDKE